MITVSSAFSTALAAGEPQRWVFKWDNGSVLSNEDISIEDGVSYDETFCSETDLTVGLTPSSSISFVLMNDEYQFLNFSFGWFVAKLGVRTAVVENDSAPTLHPTLTLSQNDTVLTVSGNGYLETYELVPFGRFYVEEPAILRKHTIEITALDQMQLFEEDMPSASALNITYPVSAADLLSAMCTYLDVDIASSMYTGGVLTFTNSTVTLASEPKSFSSASMREVLGWIAEVACCVARFNRNGELVFVWLNRLTRSYSEGNYTGFDRTEYSTTPVDKLSIRNEDSTEETVVKDPNTEDSPYMIQDNPFLPT